MSTDIKPSPKAVLTIKFFDIDTPPEIAFSTIKGITPARLDRTFKKAHIKFKEMRGQELKRLDAIERAKKKLEK